MALLQNGYRDFSSGVRIAGATASNNACPSALLSNTFRASTMRNMIGSEGIPSALVGVPGGARTREAWVMPTTAGALAARNTIAGAGAAYIAMAGGVNGSATLAGSGALTGTAALIVSLVAALTGSGTLSASAVGYLNLAASLAGAGDVSAAMRAIGQAAAALSGSGTTTATIRATGSLASSIVVTGDALTSANVGAAVWSAPTTANDIAGTMGEKLNDAGSAGNPWATVIESGLTAEAVLRIIAAAVAGETSGAPDGPVAFTGLDGSTVRLTGDVDSDGNRSNVTVDGA